MVLLVAHYARERGGLFRGQPMGFNVICWNGHMCVVKMVWFWIDVCFFPGVCLQRL